MGVMTMTRWITAAIDSAIRWMGLESEPVDLPPFPNYIPTR